MKWITEQQNKTEPSYIKFDGWARFRGLCQTLVCFRGGGKKQIIRQLSEIRKLSIHSETSPRVNYIWAGDNKRQRYIYRQRSVITSSRSAQVLRINRGCIATLPVQWIAQRLVTQPSRQPSSKSVLMQDLMMWILLWPRDIWGCIVDG
jgi:hypothetical protein